MGSDGGSLAQTMSFKHPLSILILFHKLIWKVGPILKFHSLVKTTWHFTTPDYISAMLLVDEPERTLGSLVLVS